MTKLETIPERALLLANQVGDNLRQVVPRRFTSVSQPADLVQRSSCACEGGVFRKSTHS